MQQHTIYNIVNTQLRAHTLKQTTTHTHTHKILFFLEALFSLYINITTTNMDLVNAPTPDDDVHMHDEKTTVRTQEFSAELLNVYYSRLFPYNEMYRWLSYGNTYGVKNTIDAGIDKNNKKVTVGQPEYFFHREISFTLDVSGEEVYIRYLNFKNAEEMRKKIMQQQPRKIDIGAVYSHEPSKHDMIPANVFKPLERELVFDIDLTDYDDVGAKGADISRVCILFYITFFFIRTFTNN